MGIWGLEMSESLRTWGTSCRKTGRNAVLKQILGNAVVAEWVDDIFKLAGLERPSIGILAQQLNAG